jgi:predicted DCC family thiol-disulfide oxidoreductase YuxK
MPAEPHPRETIFYDGTCGLCHAFVRFVVFRDRQGTFLFAPLGGEHFRETVREPQPQLPNSVMVCTEDGARLFRSDAALHVFRRLGRGWRRLAALLAVVPRPLLDGGYNWIARVRGKLFRAPADACPIVPPHLRERFKL